MVSHLTVHKKIYLQLKKLLKIWTPNTNSEYLDKKIPINKYKLVGFLFLFPFFPSPQNIPRNSWW